MKISLFNLISVILIIPITAQIPPESPQNLTFNKVLSWDGKDYYYGEQNYYVGIVDLENIKFLCCDKTYSKYYSCNAIQKYDSSRVYGAGVVAVGSLYDLDTVSYDWQFIVFGDKSKDSGVIKHQYFEAEYVYQILNKCTLQNTLTKKQKIITM